MNSSQVPAKFPIAWASAAGTSFVRTIPKNASSTPGAASLATGFPPLNFQDPDTGGIPPFGEDFNGILNWITEWILWQQSGGLAGYDAAQSTAIGGYYNGAVLISADGTHFWRSTADNNTSDPDTGGANWQVLQPGAYPWASITGAPDFVQRSEFTGSNQSLGTTGWQKLPGGFVFQRVQQSVSGAANNEVTVTYPIAFTTYSDLPIPAIQDPARVGDESNFLGLSVVSHSLTGCVIAMGQNGGGARDVTLTVFATGK